MPGKPAAKHDEMRRNGSFNHRAAAVTAEIFKDSYFFDANDLVQVKYEMLRAVEKDNREVSSTSAAFGFSRVSYYQIKKEYDESGVPGLLPKKRGPKGPRKLSSGDIEFARGLVGTHTKSQIVSRLRDERGVAVSKRTLERQLSVKKNP
jgi:transposase